MRAEDPQYRLVVSLVGGSHFVNHAYMMLLPPVFLPLQSELGLTTTQLGATLGLFGAVVVALQLPFGYLSDAKSRTLVLALSLGVGTVGAVLTATAQSYAWLLGAQVVLGVGVAGHHPAHYPLLSAVSDDATRGRAYSVHGFTGVLGFAAPPAVVGVASTIGLDWRVAVGSLAILGGLYGVGCLGTFRRRVPRRVTHPAPGTGSDATPGTDSTSETEGDPGTGPDGTREPGTGSDATWEPGTGTDATPDPGDDTAGRSVTHRLRRGWAALRGRPAILALTVLWFATSVASWGIKQFTGTLLVDGYAVDPGVANLVVSAMLATGAVLIFVGGWSTDRFSASRVLGTGYVGLVVVAGVLAWRGLPAVAALALTLVLSATVDASRPARSALGDRFSARGDLGKNFGLLTIGISGGVAVAPPAFGVVVDRADVGTAFFVVAALGVVALALTALVVHVGAER